MEKFKIQYKDFIRIYKVIRREKSNAIGEYFLMKNMKNKKNYFVKVHETFKVSKKSNQSQQYSIQIQGPSPGQDHNLQNFSQFENQNQQQYEIEKDQQVISTINKAIDLNNHPFLIKFKGYSSAQPPHSDFYLLFIIYEISDMGLSLEQYLNKQLQKKADLEEKFLWSFLYNMVDVLSFLEELGIRHSDIHPRNISLFKGDLQPIFKIFYSSYTISSFDQISKYGEPYTNFFLSPEQMQALNNELPEETFNPYKSDVFSLGSLLLHMGSLGVTYKMYDPKDLSINEQSLNKKIQHFQQLYTKKLFKILEQMLEVHPEERLTFVELRNILQKVQSSGFVSPPKRRQDQMKRKPPVKLSVERNNKNKELIKASSPPRKMNINRSHQTSIHSLSRFDHKFSPTPLNEIEQNTSMNVSDNRVHQFSTDKLNQNLREELQQNVERKSRENSKIFQNRLSKSPVPSQRGSFYRPVANSPYKRSIQGSMIMSSTYSVQQKRPRKPVQSPESLHRKYKSELEKDLIYDQNGNLKKGMQEKKYIDGSIYIGQMSKDQREGIGIYYYQSGEVYAGEWRGNLLYGKGRYIFSNGEMYEGEIVEGKKEGKGHYKYHNGNEYNGEWKNDKKHGYGHYKYYQKGEEYMGDFNEGLRNGKGTYVFYNGDTFEGLWKDGQKNGHGTVDFRNGCRFEGEWKFDQANGQGKLMYANGDVYEGNYSCGIKEGDGIYVFMNSNTKFQGNWEKELPNNFGQYHYSNGDIYEGQVAQGLRQGKGSYTYSNGERYEGYWKNDKKNGQGHLIYEDGTEYDGAWFNNDMHGQGKIIYDNGDIYEGNWVRNQKQGKGIYFWAQGGQYEGLWFDDQMNGFGIYTSPEGFQTEGQFKNNQFVED